MNSKRSHSLFFNLQQLWLLPRRMCSTEDAQSWDVCHRSHSSRAHKWQTKKATDGWENPDEKEVDMVTGSLLQLTIFLVDDHTENRDTSTYTELSSCSFTNPYPIISLRSGPGDKEMFGWIANKRSQSTQYVAISLNIPKFPSERRKWKLNKYGVSALVIHLKGPCQLSHICQSI